MRRQIKIFQYPQTEQGGQALAIGRNLMQPHLTVIQVDGADPVADVRCEIISRKRSTQLRRVPGHFLRQRTVVKALAARLRDLLKRLCLTVQDPFLTRVGCSACWREITNEIGLIFQHLGLARPTHSSNRRNKMAFARVTNRRPEQAFEWQLAKFCR